MGLRHEKERKKEHQDEEETRGAKEKGVAMRSIHRARGEAISKVTQEHAIQVVRQNTKHIS